MHDGENPRLQESAVGFSEEPSPVQATPFSPTSILDVPVRMRRPLEAGVAFGGKPLMKAARADAAGIKRVPQMSATARPDVMGAGRPVAVRTPDARTGRILAGGLLNIKHGLVDYERHFP